MRREKTCAISLAILPLLLLFFIDQHATHATAQPTTSSPLPFPSTATTTTPTTGPSTTALTPLATPANGLGTTVATLTNGPGATTPASTPPPLTGVNGTNGVVQDASYYTADNPLQLRVGLLAPNATSRLRDLMGFGQSAPAINIAMQRIRAEHLIDNINLTYVWYEGDCNQTTAVGSAIQLIEWYGVDVIIGPPCSTAAISAGVVAGFYNIPMFVWGASTAASLTDFTNYPTLASVTVDTYSLSLGLRQFFTSYNWTNIAFVYTVDAEEGVCEYFQVDFENALNNISGGASIVYKHQMDSSEDSMKQTLKELQIKARIVVVCIDNDGDKRNFLVYVDQLGMNTNTEYVFIFPSTRAEGMLRQADNGTYFNFWQDTAIPPDGRDAQALRTARMSVVFDVQSLPVEQVNAFGAQVVADFGNFPFFCKDSCLGPIASDRNSASIYASSLYDTIYMYAMIVNHTMEASLGTDLKTTLRNGTRVGNVSSLQFPGMTGYVRIESGTRAPILWATALDISDKPTTYVNISVSVKGEVILVDEYSDAATTIWATRGGKRPLDTPLCGYTGTQCPINATAYIALGGGLILLFLTIAAGGVGYALRERAKEQERLNRECLIPFTELRRIDPTSKSTEALKSLRSMQSGATHSTSGGSGGEGVKSIGLSSQELAIDPAKLETENHAFYSIGKEVVYAQKYPIRVRLSTTDMGRLRKLRQFDHDNVNRFIGICVDGPAFMAVWKYCHRGSLQDVLQRESSYINDSFVMFAMIRDMANGLSAMHNNSSLGAHGNLTSQCCLINDRWQLKIAEHGLDMITNSQPTRRKKLVWRAPELLRNGDRRGTKEGDIYSFAIICSELVNKEHAWGGVEKEVEVDEVIYRVKRGGENIYRPELHPPGEQDINPNLLHLIKDCWTEEPQRRPRIDEVRSLLKQMVKKGDQNLLDYVFGMLEVYANSLEQEVQERTKELVEEKRKSDTLLYRMLPKQVADKLRVGESVQPEQFEQATIFFSDVVSFTSLASRCTPLQVVNLLNELYSTLDNIIDIHDAYKVETIGDGYLVVSGIPHRNGDQHAKEIAELSLDFMRSLITFRIPHLPKERINLRIGVHTGPTVAGVVGLTMPRYCLFGDSVNTASRMESNGKPGMIHISPETNHYLVNMIGGYVTQPRGDIIVKGKGVMETYWLLGRHGDPEIDPLSSHAFQAAPAQPAQVAAQPNNSVTAAAVTATAAADEASIDGQSPDMINE